MTTAALGLRDFGRGLLVELQVLYAIILRETRTRFGESHLGYLWALMQPMFYIVPMIWLFELLGRKAPMGMSVVGFLATGLLPFFMFRNCTTRLLAAINSNKGLLGYPQVRPYSLMTARTLLEGATWITVFCIIVGGEAIALGAIPADDLLQVMLGLGLTIGLGASFGALLCCINVHWDVLERFVPLMIRPLFWFSGIFFIVDELPPQVAHYFLYNPLLHTITLVRMGWFANYESHLIDPWYPFEWIVVMSFLALFLERGIRGRQFE